MNVDFRGRLSLCCNLSGYRGAAEELDVVADLNVESFDSAYSKFIHRPRNWRNEKQRSRSCERDL